MEVVGLLTLDQHVVFSELRNWSFAQLEAIEALFFPNTAHCPLLGSLRGHCVTKSLWFLEEIGGIVCYRGTNAATEATCTSL